MANLKNNIIKNMNVKIENINNMCIYILLYKYYNIIKKMRRYIYA